MTAAVHDTALLAFVYDRRVTPTATAVELRLEVCREYAAEMRWQVAGEWIDTGDDALSDHQRPQLELMVSAMAAAAAEGRPVVCLVAGWDRLSRDPLRLSGLRWRIARAGGYTATAAGQDDRLTAATERAMRPA